MTTPLLAVLCIAGAASATDTSSLFLHENAADRAVEELAGSGITLPDGRVSTAAVDAHGRGVVWREQRSSADERGGKHVFYRQHVVDDGVEVELVGSDMGFHYDADGRLTSVAGTQYRNVMITNTPQIDGPAAAATARRALTSFARAGAAADTPRDGKLQIRQAPGGDLRYVWRTRHISGSDDRTVYVDAQSGQVLGIGSGARNANCYPDSMTHVSAVGIPVRASGTRALGATPVGSGGRGGYTHEAFWGIGPLLAVHQEVDASSSWQCVSSSSNRSYSLVAINSSGGTPTYDDTTPFKGRAAGDALHHTNQTMQAFSTMGWSSWDGQSSNATAIVQSTYAAQNQARFVTPDGHDSTSHPNLPPGAAVAIGTPNNRWSMAAALDVIAHEWGHGVTYTRAEFPVDGDTADPATLIAQQLDEGFADVIANIVERLRHSLPSGYTMQAGDADEQAVPLEKSGDWTIHEDVAGYTNAPTNTILGYARGAKDDGPSGHYYPNQAGTFGSAIKDRLHKNDPDVPLTPYGPHDHGNMLVVVLKLLTEGGKNPLCYRTSAPGFCTSAPNVTALGFTKARKILWDTIARVPANAYWEDAPYPATPNPSRVVGNHAMEAAYQLNKMCNASPVYVPTAEQQAVKDAFTNIGYTPTQAVKTSCQ
ncbi:MAG TPA: hypothetical protein VF266_14915 [Thermoanaerobaculia bacterium]